MILRSIRLLLAIAVLGGCGAKRDGAGDPMPNWQRATILGGYDRAAETTAPRPIDGPVGVGATRGGSSIFPGDTPLAAARPGLTYFANGDVSLDLRDVPAGDAATAVLGDVLKVPYVVDPRVQGRVTLRTSAPMSPRAVLGLLEAALRPAGAVIVVRDNEHHVVPAEQGNQRSTTPVVTAPAGRVAGFASRAVQLRYIPAAEMAEILRPLAPDSANVRVDSGRNVIVLSGTGAEHEAWMETVRTFDVDWLANRPVAVFRINGMPAEQMVKGLVEILRNENVDQQLVRFLPLDSGNAVLAVAKTPDALRAARQWLVRLEAAAGRRSQLYSYQMKFAQAKQVLPILTRLLGAEGSPDQAGRETTNDTPRRVSSQTDQRRTSGGTTIPSRDTGMSGGDQSGGVFTQTPALRQADPRVARVAGSSPEMGDADAASVFRIVVNEPTNTLLIYGTDEEYRRVRGVLRTLDVPPRQVLVEATIVEVSLTEDLRHGVQYFLSSRIKGMPIEAVLTNGNFTQVSPEAPGFGLTLAAPAKVVIDALSTITRLNVISAPNVMVVNNQSARLVVGDQVPIATQSRQDPLQNNQVVVNTIELRDTGVIFEVTPRISSSGSVLLDIVQEVSSVKPQSDPSLTPTLSQRKLSSSVTVEHGETIVLGGLFSSQRGSGTTGLPFLSELPVIGNAFGRATRDGARTELIVLITPKIINDRQEARMVTSEIRDRLQQLQSEERAAPATRGGTSGGWDADVRR